MAYTLDFQLLFAIPFLLFLGIILPLLGLASLKHTATDRAGQNEVPSVRAIAAQLGILQTIVACLGLLAAHGVGLELVWSSAVTPVTLISSFAVLAGFVGLAFLEARRPLGPNEQIRAEMRKVSAGDPAWIGVTLYAGLIEEFAYRGVLTLILASFIGYWSAAIASALLFGLGHLSAGWRGAGSGVLFALAMQAIVYLSGGLLLAALVHAIYDLLAAWLGNRIANRDGSSAAAA